VAFSNGRERERRVMFDIIFPLQRRFIRFRPPLLYPCIRCDGRASIEESLSSWLPIVRRKRRRIISRRKKKKKLGGGGVG
jgi:hypothetical protein